METRINRTIEIYTSKFKNDIKEWIHNCDGDGDNVIDDNTKSNLLKYIFDYENLSLSKTDFQKRKRIKNNVPHHNRCCAKRANGEQCTRRKKEDGDFCGTHNKGIPHGQVVYNDTESTALKKKIIWVQDIQGINCYIDEENNVYDHEQVLTSQKNPKIIATYKCENGIYSIPEYNKG